MPPGQDPKPPKKDSKKKKDRPQDPKPLIPEIKPSIKVQEGKLDPK
jgi:hypothetical protein